MNYHSVLELLEKLSETTQLQGDSNGINGTEKVNSEQTTVP